MTQADRVHSTPPTNTPIDTTRRRLLNFVARAAVAAAIPTGAAALPTAAAVDPAFALIAKKLATDVAHSAAIDAQNDAETQYGRRSEEKWEADEKCEAMRGEVDVICWKLGTTPPTTLAGVAALLRFVNEVEDAGLEWPDTDTIGSEGWHYQLRATMAAAIETIIRRELA